jgi:hypothetical protein
MLGITLKEQAHDNAICDVRDETPDEYAVKNPLPKL